MCEGLVPFCAFQREVLRLSKWGYFIKSKKIRY